MERIQNFKSFSQLKTQLREEATQKEMAAKLEAAGSQYGELLKKYNVASAAEISEDQLPEFMAELLGEAKPAADKAKYDRTMKAMAYAKELKAKKEKEAKAAALTKSARRYHGVKESVELVEEGTRGFFGKIDKNGNIAAVYTHYDSYPENMLPTIKKGYMNGKNVDAVIAKGDNSGLEADINKMNFYNDKNSMKPLTGKADKVDAFIKNAKSDGGAEFVYLYDEREGKWMMADTHKHKDLIPAFESVTNEAEVMIFNEIGAEIEALYSKLNDLAEETTDSAWRKAIDNIIKGVEAVEKNISKFDSKLGVIPTHESAEVNESHFNLGDTVTCIQSGMTGQVIGSEGEGPSEIYTVKREDGEVERYSPEELQLVDRANEGNAFSAARAKAIADGEKEFEVDGKKYPVTDVDAEDKKNAEEFVSEGAKEEQTAMELYVKLVDPRQGEYTQPEMEKMNLDELEDVVIGQGFRGKQAKDIAKELLKVARG